MLTFQRINITNHIDFPFFTTFILNFNVSWQHASREKLADEYGALRRTRIVKQGDNSLSFYSAAV